MYFRKIFEERRAFFFGAGTVFGFLLALVGLFFQDGGSLFPDSVAYVNGTSIGKEEYLRALNGYASDSKNPLTDETRSRVLERLIEEELLVQRGLELGFASQDKAVRAAIVRSVIQSVTSETSSDDPTDITLRTYYMLNREKFSGSPGYRLSIVEEEDKAEASKISAEWKKNGNSPNQSVLDLPRTPLPARKWIDYIGPDAAELLTSLKPGETSSPIPHGKKFLILHLISVEAGPSRPFREIKEEIKSYYLQEKGSEALREYLEALKKKSKIQRNSLDRLSE